MTYLWIGLGGFLGANMRYVVGRYILDRCGAGFPWGTLVANVTGAFLIGLLFEALAEHMIDHPFLRPLIIVGLLGGYTTFSTFSLETITLMETDRIGKAALYVVGSVIIGLTACYGGMLLGRRVG